MKFFDKLRQNFRKSSQDISHISGDLIEKTKKVSSQGLETMQKLYSQIEGKTTEATHIVKLKMEIAKIQKQIQHEKMVLGKQAFDIAQKKGAKLTKSALADQINTIVELGKRLEATQFEYDNLRKDMSDSYVVEKLSQDLESSGGTIDLFVVPEKSAITNKTLKEITLPKDVLITAIKKGTKVTIPDGNTKLEAGDQVTIIGKIEDVEKTVAQFAGK
ncbi:hypothetical protein B6D60_00405 [candidate division KSB1 bacterium 4484_87]|nr:MAG: hypothetical protein B6D60_00405 [candidate division KSB1 bacterium 4484_87]